MCSDVASKTHKPREELRCRALPLDEVLEAQAESTEYSDIYIFLICNIYICIHVYICIYIYAILSWLINVRLIFHTPGSSLSSGS